jgi:hypothetical protein
MMRHYAHVKRPYTSTRLHGGISLGICHTHTSRRENLKSHENWRVPQYLALTSCCCSSEGHIKWTTDVCKHILVSVVRTSTCSPTTLPGYSQCSHKIIAIVCLSRPRPLCLKPVPVHNEAFKISTSRHYRPLIAKPVSDEVFSYYINVWAG